MAATQLERLNLFFVQTLNKILTIEEKALMNTGFNNLSVREFHILEAVPELEQMKNNTITHIATKLDISVGALTTPVNVLVKKGYLERAGREDDRRIVLVRLTPLAKAANEKHSVFHKEMIEKIGELLSERDLYTLMLSLERLSNYFGSLHK